MNSNLYFTTRAGKEARIYESDWDPEKKLSAIIDYLDNWAGATTDPFFTDLFRRESDFCTALEGARFFIREGRWDQEALLAFARSYPFRSGDDPYSKGSRYLYQKIHTEWEKVDEGRRIEFTNLTALYGGLGAVIGELYIRRFGEEQREGYLRGFSPPPTSSPQLPHAGERRPRNGEDENEGCYDDVGDGTGCAPLKRRRYEPPLQNPDVEMEGAEEPHPPRLR